MYSSFDFEVMSQEPVEQESVLLGHCLFDSNILFILKVRWGDKGSTEEVAKVV